jgi:hypothetical protein
MSLAHRLAAVVPTRSNRGCQTCAYLTTLTPQDLRAFKAWIDESRSIAQLWDIATSDTDNPLRVSITGLRHHVRHHRIADES